MNIILPAAGFGIRRNSLKSKIDMAFDNNKKLYEYQLEEIKKHYPKATITYIINQHHIYIKPRLEELGCNVEIETSYRRNNVPYTISKFHSFANTLIIYGDLFCTSDTLNDLPKNPSGSFIVKDISNNFSRKNIGVGPNTILDFAFDEKWSQIVYFDKTDGNKIDKLLEDIPNQKKFMFELINDATDNNSQFQVFFSSGYCHELDTITDYKSINRWIYENTN